MTEETAIGLDFGTTNTLLSYYDDMDGPRLHQASMGESSGPIPSLLVAKAGKVRRFLAGLIGIGHYDDDDVEIRENFKLDLPQVGGTADARLKHSSFLAARDFIDQVIRDYKAGSVTGQIDRLCISAPEAWVRGQEQVANEALRQITRGLALPAPVIISEPVAAAAYFAYRYHRRTKHGFRGHAFVYDHGGGTLDLSLVKIDGVRVTPVDGDGLSIDDNPMGYGGVAFDQMMLDYYLSTDEKMAKFSDKEKRVWLRKFEREKRGCPVDLERRYSRIMAGFADEEGELFDVPKVRKYRKSVTVEDIRSVFIERYKPRLQARLDKFLEHCSSGNDAPDFAYANNFRVLMVGGFSEFYPVRRMVEDVFRERFGSENDVFTSHFSKSDRWSAISRGACLVAANRVRVDDLCPCTFGLVTYGETENDKDYHPLVQRGDPVDKYSSVVYFEGGAFGVNTLDESAAPAITFYIERAGERMAMKGKTGLSDLLPDFGTARSWQFGANIVKGVISIYIKSDASPHPRRVRLGEFFDVIDASDKRVINDDDFESISAVA